nr:ABC transporter permease [Elusimicrobiota bacterium]
MWRFYGRRFLANRLALAGASVLLFLGLAAVGAPVLSRTDPNQQRLTERLMPPSVHHLLGTDDLGRDVAARMLHGGRVSLRVGLVAVGISVIIGTWVGVTAGFFGGWVDGLLMRVVDIMLCFPTLFLILMVIAFLDPSLWTVMTVIGLTSWPGLARL